VHAIQKARRLTVGLSNMVISRISHASTAEQLRKREKRMCAAQQAAAAYFGRGDGG